MAQVIARDKRKSFRTFLRESWEIVKNQRAQYGDNVEDWDLEDLKGAQERLCKLSDQVTCDLESCELSFDDLLKLEVYRANLGIAFQAHHLSFY